MRRHPSERLVMDRLGRRYNRLPQQPEPEDDRIPPVRLLNYYLMGALLAALLIIGYMHEVTK